MILHICTCPAKVYPNRHAGRPGWAGRPAGPAGRGVDPGSIQGPSRVDPGSIQGRSRVGGGRKLKKQPGATARKTTGIICFYGFGRGRPRLILKASPYFISPADRWEASFCIVFPHNQQLPICPLVIFHGQGREAFQRPAAIKDKGGGLKDKTSQT